MSGRSEGDWKVIQKGQRVGGMQTMLSCLFVRQKFVTNVIVRSRIAYKLNKKFIESRSNKNQSVYHQKQSPGVFP